MIGIKVSNLPPAPAPIDGTELVNIVQGGVSVKTPANTLADLPGTAAAAIVTHKAETDPHPGYLTPAEGDAAYEPKSAAIQSHISSTANPHAVTAAQAGADPTGTAAAAIVTHKAETDPHPGYLTPAEGDAAYEPKSAAIQSHISSTANPHAVTAAQVGAYTAAQTDTLLNTKLTKFDGEPNGFLDRTQVTLAFDAGTRTVSLTGTFSIYANGTLYSKTGDSIVIANTEGQHYIYYNSSGVLVESTTFVSDIILRFCFVASLYWDATNSRAVPRLLAETHGAEMPAEVHSYLHATLGTQYVSGLALTVTSNGNGSTAAHAQVASTEGQIRDEDIPHTILARVNTDTLPILYRTGVGGLWRVHDSAAFAVITAGSGRAAWNQNSGGTWALAEVSNGDYLLSHVYALPGTNPAAGTFAVVVGQGTYTSISAARAAALSEAAGLQLSGLPTAEFKLVTTLIFQSANTYGNAVKSRIVPTDTGADYIDWRTTGPMPAQAISGSVWGAITGTLSSQLDLAAALSPLQSHILSTANPHAVTAAQVGADAAGTAAAAIVVHKAEADPHPQYPIRIAAGTVTLNGADGVTISIPGVPAANYTVHLTPTGITTADAGEISVVKADNTATVYNSGRPRIVADYEIARK